ncbi:MAG TPA: acyltransferase, partial [Acidocella sp.]|nr:acyltransferase [Acidocella sp.]
MSLKHHYGFIDAVRGIAACSVMLQHSLNESGLLGDFHHHTKLTNFIPTWLELGETGVVAFFLVSGFVIPLSLEKTANFRLFWLHRACRIYPLYLFIYFITFVLHAGVGIHSLNGFSINFAAHLFFVQEYLKQISFVGGSWTLSLEMIWYITLSCLFIVSLNKNAKLLVSASVVISVLADIACSLGHHIPMGRVSMLLCCVTGLLCYRHEKRDISNSTFYALLAIMAATIFCNIFVGFQLFPSPHPSATFCMVLDSWSCAALIFFVPFVKQHWKIWNVSGFKFFARISYSVY